MTQTPLKIRHLAWFASRATAFWLLTITPPSVSATLASEKPVPLNPWHYQVLYEALRDPLPKTQIEALLWIKKNKKPRESAPVPLYLFDELRGRLLRAKNSEDQLTTLKAIAAFGEDSSSMAPVVVTMLNNNNDEIRSAAEEALEGMGSASAQIAPNLKGLLNSSNQEIRHVAARVLGRMGRTGILSTADVATLLKDADQTTRDKAYPDDVVDSRLSSSEAEMRKALRVGSPNVIGALFTVTNMGEVGIKFIPEMVALLKSEDSTIRLAALNSLTDMGKGVVKFSPVIVDILRDGEEPMREQAMENLRILGEYDASVAIQVAALLKDKDPDTRIAAVAALAHMGKAGAKFAHEAVTELFRHRGLGSKMIYPAKILEDMHGDGEAFASELARIVTGKDKESEWGRLFAIEGLAFTGKEGEKYAPEVAACLKNADPEIRIAALGTLVKMDTAGPKFATEVASLLKDKDPKVRQAAAETLGNFGERGAKFSPNIMALLEEKDQSVRIAAIRAIGNMGENGAKFAPKIMELLDEKDPSVLTQTILAIESMGITSSHFATRIAMLLKDKDYNTRQTAANALANMAVRIGPINTPSVLAGCLDSSLLNRDQRAQFRFVCHLLGPFSGEEKILLEQFMDDEGQQLSKKIPVGKTETVKVLKAIQTLWPYIDARNPTGNMALNPVLLGKVTSTVQKIASANAAQLDLEVVFQLEDLIRKFENAGQESDAAGLREVRDRIKYYVWLKRGLITAFGHIGFWVLLVCAYPRWRPVQSFFFWNRWGRRFLGLGYVGFAITHIPWLRHRMFLPFKDSLVQYGALAKFDADSYFSDVQVVEKNLGTAKPCPIEKAIASISGQIVLEGESGIGKTTMLLNLATTSPRISVLLRATECSHGVVTAIQSRLQGQVRDEDYLRSLIHMGAIDVFIDGLNEAIPATRARIVQFVEEFFQGNFILTTQPMDWTAPRTARILNLLPLQISQVEAFLLKQWPAIKASAEFSEIAYREVVKEYLGNIITDSQNCPQFRVLSNPMEASLVAELLSRKERPDLLRLVEQRFLAMEQTFQERENREFPYSIFAETVYSWRQTGKPYFDPTGLDAEVTALVDHKIMITRTVSVRKPNAVEDESRWWFRHDKFMEFCLLPAFMGDHADRQQQHFLDETFFGVYDLLSLKLSDSNDEALLNFLTERAADTQRNDLLNRYTRARRSRKALNSHPAPVIAE